MGEQSHEKLEHFYKKFEQNNKFHCYENKTVEACHGLGEYYQKVNRKQEALLAYHLNCFENEFGPSCLEYVRVIHDRGVFSNPAEAYKAAEIGCTGKTPDNRCCSLLGKMLELPDDSPMIKGMNRKQQDLKKARQLYEKGCADKEGESCVLAARLALKSKNFRTAVSYAERACDYCSLVKGCRMAAELHKVGESDSGIKPNEGKFNEYKRKMLDLLPVKMLEDHKTA